MPGDVRNDMYVTIVRAEFERGTKKSGRNVDVEVAVVLDTGQVLNNCISMGVGEPPVGQYHSTVYYHTNSPVWHETLKLEIPIEEFERAHLRFYFRHCSSQETRDKHAIFAFAFLPLMSDAAKDGITVKVIEVICLSVLNWSCL